jgi:hypothetical protein
MGTYDSQRAKKLKILGKNADKYYPQYDIILTHFVIFWKYTIFYLILG